MRVKLLKNRYNIEYLDGDKPINANDVMVNSFEVELESPLLNGETLWVVFDNKEVLLKTTKPILATNEYTVAIPGEVIKVPGKWEFQLFIKTFDAVKGMLLTRSSSEVGIFTIENGLYVDDEMDLANNGSLASLYAIATKNTQELPLVSNFVLEFAKTYAEIVELTNAGGEVDSFPVDGFNRRPNIGERFFSVCTSGDKYGFGMTAEVVRFDTIDAGREFAVFKCIEVVVLAGSTILKQVGELERRMARIDGGEGGDGGEGEEDPSAIIPLVLNNSVNLGDIRVQVNSLFSVDVGQFNRKPSKNEYFLAIAYDANGKVYAIRAIAQMPGETSVRCKIAKVNILHDEERLASIETIADKLDTVEEIAKGAQQAESFTSYAEMVEALRSEFLGGSDGLTELKYKKGQSIYIETVDVPDLWVSRIEEDNFNPYTYTNDEAIVSAIATNGYIQVGHYRLARLENGKVIMSDYLRKIDVKNSNGIEVSPEGAVRLSPAFPAELRDRAYYKPVTGGNLDAALLYGLSENKLIPTEAQKNAMLNWLGAMKKGGGNDIQVTSTSTCALKVSYNDATHETEIYADKVRVAWAGGAVHAYYQHDGIYYGCSATGKPIGYKLLYPTDIEGEKATIETRERVEGLPQRAGWKITKHKFNHAFSFGGDGVTHAGVASFIEYERMDDSTKHMITADIQITSGEDITNPEDFKVTLVTLGTKWKSAGMLVSGVFPDGFKDATKYTHMTVDKYSWIMDQTEGSVGLLDGVGTVIPQVYAVRDASGYNAVLWGIAVELTKTNSGKPLHIDGKHICLTFYDFHTVTDA